MALAYPARDQLRILRAEIEDEDFFVVQGTDARKRKAAGAYSTL
jgi:hypothetical protein